MSFSKVKTAAISGMEVVPVNVECDVNSGLPVLHMVGYLSSEVKEAAQRVKTAITNSGFSVPATRIVINLSPGNMKKRGSSYDLPIALGILAATGRIRPQVMGGILAVGELGLDGTVRGVKGVLPIAGYAKETGCRLLIVPTENEKEAKLVEELQILCADRLDILIKLLNDDVLENKGMNQISYMMKEPEYDVDFADIRGQETVKRAAQVAVAGGHNLLMVGPPGSGKSMIAKRIPTILPGMSREESLEVTKVYSIAGQIRSEEPLIRVRPFREVHQTVTKAGLIGGGLYPKPGEISLASKGVLFLDELAEFPRAVIEVLRQPLEEKVVRIVRAHNIYEYPADVMLVAATNPCPCGYYPDRNRCHCTENQIIQYQGKISQPFLGRMDICIEVPNLPYEELETGKVTASSAVIQERVEQARKIQLQRNDGVLNGNLKGDKLIKVCKLGQQENTFIRHAYDALYMNARVYHKVLKVSRTIADLEGAQEVRTEHLQEAIAYRNAGQFFGKAGE